jgi:hypothetical protein
VYGSKSRCKSVRVSAKNPLFAWLHVNLDVRYFTGFGMNVLMFGQPIHLSRCAVGAAIDVSPAAIAPTALPSCCWYLAGPTPHFGLQGSMAACPSEPALPSGLALTAAMPPL